MDQENEYKEPLAQRFWAFFLDFAETIVIALAIFVIVYRFLFQPHQVKGQSMFDNFHDGEYLLTNKIDFNFRDPENGEVIVFKAPKNEDYDYIKRVIGVPGDTVMVKEGRVYVNGSLLDESGYLDSSIITRAGRYAVEGLSITVPANNFYVMGDNRDNSSDSRDWGLVPSENLVGHAWIRYWPINHTGFVKRYPKATK